ncbi:Chromosome partition protein Smc [Botrimarina colliarenosi]|uniref:Chromosome partition protein Smc n=1 Tax=Botrimarina colliarenosi TaxID=2528001 RepID=A0A5C6ANL6_9BACT|nr:hypothetical protein [Botrimarina colliarenosi]TWU00696.1 Chromosome partition protein Smc [Botrimarina colliarenosi]
MSEATIDAPIDESLHALVEDWTQAEAGRAEELHRLLEPIEQAMAQLTEWADRIAAAEASEATARNEAASRDQAAEDRRRKLEHDLKLSRTRVAELEKSLQERTAELLRLQAANNELAAQLQEIDDEESPSGTGGPTTDPPHDGDLMSIPADDATFADIAVEVDGNEGVAERFARLRRT